MEQPYAPNQTEVDLHILVVPSNQWRPDLHLAYSSTCMASVSAGFVRVDPGTSLSSLRKKMAMQIDKSSLPHSYIFLRNVGRHLCRVSTSQELSLESKLFVPPLAPCPEIYILDTSCTSEIMQSPLQSPGFYYSPQATQTPSNHPATTSKYPAHGSSLSHKSGGLEHPLQVTNSPATLQEHHSSKGNGGLDLKTKRVGIRSSLGLSKQQAGSHMQKSEEQICSTLRYQPQNDGEIIQQRKPVQEVSGPTESQPPSNYESATEVDHEAQVISKSPSNTNAVSMHSEVLLGQKTRQRVHFENLPMSARGRMNSSAEQSVSHRSHAAQHSNKGIPFSSQPPESSLPSDSLEGLSLVAGTQQSDFSPHKHLPPILTSENTLPSQEPATPYEVSVLLTQIKQMKHESKHLTATKDSLSTALRHLQQEVRLRKEKDDEVWKQKYIDEKKQTGTLKESIKRLKMEVQGLKKQKRRKTRNTTQKHFVEESVPDNSNVKIQCKRFDLSIEALRHTLEEEKRKLQIEWEKHQIITEECKTLKKELIQKKIAYNREKKRMY